MATDPDDAAVAAAVAAAAVQAAKAAAPGMPNRTAGAPVGRPAGEDEAVLMGTLPGEFEELVRRVGALDDEDGSRFLPVLTHLPLDQVYDKLDSIQSFALRLGFDEAREMQRGHALGVFDAGAPHAPGQPPK